MSNIVKLNGVNPNVIKLKLFPFSLRDIAASLSHPDPMRCIVHVTVGAHMCTKCHCNILGSCY